MGDASVVGVHAQSGSIHGGFFFRDGPKITQVAFQDNVPAFEDPAAAHGETGLQLGAHGAGLVLGDGPPGQAQDRPGQGLGVHTVGESVAVRVGPGGIGTEQVLLAIGQPVPVHVGTQAAPAPHGHQETQHQRPPGSG